MSSPRRSTIALSRELARGLSDVAEKKKVSRYNLGNELVGTALRVCEEGGDVDQLYASWKLMKLSWEVGGYPLASMSLIDRMVTRLFAKDKDWLLGAWRDEGTVVGKILAFYYRDLSDLEPALIQVFPSFPRKLEVRRVSDDEVHFVVRIVGQFSMELGLCLEQFIQGALSAFSLAPIHSKVTRNIVDASFGTEDPPLPLSSEPKSAPR